MFIPRGKSKNRRIWNTSYMSVVALSHFENGRDEIRKDINDRNKNKKEKCNYGSSTVILIIIIINRSK